MKSKPASKALCILMILCLLISSASASTVAGETIQPRYSSINLFTTGLEVSAAGRADCCAFVSVDDDDTVTLIMSLKKSSDGVTWSIEKTWSVTGTRTVALEKSYYVVSGYYYKVATTATVYNENGYYLETGNLSSSITNYGV